MASVEELKALLERVREAIGPERGIDFYLHTYTNGKGTIARCPKYTGSIEAALGLVDRALPGVDWSVGREVHKSGAWIGGEQADAATPPLAILAALLSALIAIEDPLPSLPTGRR